MNEDGVKAVWQWIIDANDGTGGDVGDLISIMNRHGMPCPSELENEG